jgi:uncharacterized membrane protein YczE
MAGTRTQAGGAGLGGGTFWPRERTAARLAQLIGGLGLYGLSEALMLAPGVGVDPWDVFHTGLARLTGIPVGTVLIVVGVLVLLLWMPLRQRPGLGTAANVVVIGAVVDLILNATPVPHTLWLRWAEFIAGVLLNAVATGLYIGAGLGAGPRDGLTTAIAARSHSIRVVRTTIELSVLVVGWLLGGNVGLGTVVYAVAIGPLVHVTIPRLSLPTRRPAEGTETGTGTSTATSTVTTVDAVAATSTAADAGTGTSAAAGTSAGAGTGTATEPGIESACATAGV